MDIRNRAPVLRRLLRVVQTVPAGDGAFIAMAVEGLAVHGIGVAHRPGRYRPVEAVGDEQSRQAGCVGAVALGTGEAVGHTAATGVGADAAGAVPGGVPRRLGRGVAPRGAAGTTLPLASMAVSTEETCFPEVKFTECTEVMRRLRMYPGFVLEEC